MLASAKLQRALLLILVALLGAIAFVIVKTPSPPTPADNGDVAQAHAEFAGPTMPPNALAPDFTLTDQNGRRVSLAADRGKVVVLTFIHSLCHDTCPFMVEQIKGALNDLPDNGRNTPTIGVSVAQAEDTVHNRKAFLAKHDMTGRIEFVNGPLGTMRRIWQEYAIHPVTPRVDHSTFVILIDKRGYERVGFAADELTP